MKGSVQNKQSTSYQTSSSALKEAADRIKDLEQQITLHKANLLVQGLLNHAHTDHCHCTSKTIVKNALRGKTVCQYSKLRTSEVAAQ